MNTVPNWVREGSKFRYPAEPNINYRYRVDVCVEQGSIWVNIEDTSGSYCSAEIPVEVIQALLEDQ